MKKTSLTNLSIQTVFLSYAGKFPDFISHVAVEFDSVTFFIDRNQGSSSTPFRAFEFSPSFEFSLDIRVMTGSGSVAVSGSDLWKVTAFFSAQADGTGTRQVSNFFFLKVNFLFYVFIALCNDSASQLDRN